MASLTGRERYRPNKQDLDWQEEQASRNISREEAVFSALAGATLVLLGINRRSWVGSALAVTGAVLLHRGMTEHCPIYEMLGADTNELGRRKVPTRRAVKLEKRVTIDRRPEELYRYWRNLSNLPRIMSHLQSVEMLNDRLSHWTVKTGPGLPTIEWDGEIVNEVENELIGWRSLAGSDVDTAGSVRFRPAAGRGTDVTVTLQYDIPGGPIGVVIAKLLGQEPERMIEEDLARFKQALESASSVRSART
jgi:uncharacterized membrane protein